MRITRLIAFACVSMFFSLNASCRTIYGQLYRNEIPERLVNDGKITIRGGSEDCLYMMTVGGNMFIGLKSGFDNGFFFTEMGSFLLAIPADRDKKSWHFKNSDYRYVDKAPPKGVVFPVKKFQTIERKTGELVRYVYVADRFNYIGDTRVFGDKTTTTLVLKKYQRKFYECQMRIRKDSGH